MRTKFPRNPFTEYDLDDCPCPNVGHFGDPMRIIGLDAELLMPRDMSFLFRIHEQTLTVNGAFYVEGLNL